MIRWLERIIPGKRPRRRNIILYLFKKPRANTIAAIYSHFGFELLKYMITK